MVNNEPNGANLISFMPEKVQRYARTDADNLYMDNSTLFMGLLTGLLGTAYFIYGKRQRKIVPILSGIGLCIVPFVLSGWVSSSLVSIVLCALPFVVSM